MRDQQYSVSNMHNSNLEKGLNSILTRAGLVDCQLNGSNKNVFVLYASCALGDGSVNTKRRLFHVPS